MDIKSMTIISNILGYGPMPSDDDEVKQFLTVSSAGEVCCRRFCFGGGADGFIEKEVQTVDISESAADRIFDHIDRFIQTYQPVMMTDVGEWTLEAVYSNGERTTICGPMIGAGTDDGIDLTEMIREEIPIKDLFVFDGC